MISKFESLLYIKNIFFLDFNLLIRLKILIIPKNLQNGETHCRNTKSLLSSSYQLFKNYVTPVQTHMEYPLCAKNNVQEK